MPQSSPNSPITHPDKAQEADTGAVLATAIPSPADEADPLAQLYKMSRTAGLGSGDYVAVNPVAVTSLVFGLAGALVVVDSLFIVLPLVGLILGIVAWRQIRKSNGTQTGGIMAGAAILLSIGFLGARVGQETLQSFQLSADKHEITHVMDVLGQNVSAIDPAKTTETASHLAAAYDMFDEAFKSRVTIEHFDGLWLEFRASPLWGQMTSLHTNGLLKFDTDPRSGDLTCISTAIAEFPHGESPRWTMVFRQLNGKWYIDNMPDLFPNAPPPSQQQPPQRPR
jgi:hypothetical protein